MRIGSPTAAPALLAVFGVIACASQVSAQTSCADLGGNIIYGVGGSAQTPLIGQIASRLRQPANEADQLTIVYADPGACFAISQLDPERTDAQRYIAATPSGTSAKYWNQGSATAQTCVLATDQLADFGTMQQFADLCPDYAESGKPDGIGDFLGPVGTVNLIVPNSSSQSSISAEALYFLFKFGADAGVEPWTNNDYITRRTRTSAVQLLLLKAAGLSESSGGDINYGWDAGTNPISVATVAGSGVHAARDAFPAVTVANTEATIGFVSGENAEGARGQVRTLAYQHTGQECAYWPDSSSTAFDKLNVRTGRYFLWSALHFYAPVSGDENAIADIVNEDADKEAALKKLAGYFTLQAETPTDLPLFNIYIDNYNIPQCAMQVSREEDLGATASFQPDEPCGCYYDFRATGRTDCQECEDSEDCPSSDPVCRFGYCEVQ